MFVALVFFIALALATVVGVPLAFGALGVPVKYLLSPPRTIVLDADARPPDAEMHTLLAPLLERGFRVVGAWRLRETPGVRVVGVVRDDGLFGAAYRHPLAGRWADVCVRFVDGTAVTATNATQGALLDQMPGRRKVFLPEHGTLDLLRVAEDERASGVPLPVPDSEFKTFFETSYAEEMAWRDVRGGATADEIARIAGGRYSPATLAATHERMHRDSRAAVENALHEAAGRPDGPLVYVHAQTEPTTVAAAALEILRRDADNEELAGFVERDLHAGAFAGMSPHAVIGRIQDALPADRRLVRLAAIEPAAPRATAPLDAAPHLAPPAAVYGPPTPSHRQT